MRRLLLAVSVTFGLLTSAPAGFAQETPAVVVRAKSLDALLGQGKVLFDQIGLGDTAAKFRELVKSKTGLKGLAGIDASRPVGLIVHFNPDPTAVLLFPINQEQAFIDLLDRLDVKASKEKGGDYVLQLPLPIPVYARITGNYAWVTALNKNGFAVKFDPAQVLGQGTAMLSARVQLDLIPKDARQLAVSQFEDALQESLKKNPPADTPGQKAFAAAWNEMLARTLKQVLDEGKEAVLDVDVESAGKQIVADLTLTPKAETPLAKSLAATGQRSSVFGGATAGTALSARLNVALPEPLAKALAQVFEEGYKEGAANLRDEAKKKQAQDLWDAIKPSLDAGEIDAVFRLVGPNAEQKYGVLLGAKTKDGDKLGGVFKTLAEEARKQMPQAEQAKVMLDADSAGPAKVHRFVLPADKGPLGAAQDRLGDATLSLAFLPDAVLAGIGADSLPALKSLAAVTKAAPSPAAALDIDIARLAPLLAPTPKLRDSAKTIFTAPDDGRVRVEATGGTTLRVRASVKTPVLQFLGQTREVRAPAKE